MAKAVTDTGDIFYVAPPAGEAAAGRPSNILMHDRMYARPAPREPGQPAPPPHECVRSTRPW